MEGKDKERFIKRYSDRLTIFGDDPKTLGWGNGGLDRQNLRFKILSEVGIQNGHSVLDVGCGFGDMYGFLINSGWKGQYLGIDINEDMLKLAKKKCPDIEVFCVDILNTPQFNGFDFVVESGIFNEKFEFCSNLEYIEKMLHKMFSICRKGIACDFLSSFVDFEAQGSFHSNPGEIITIAKKMSDKIVMRMDYLQYEFSIYCKK